MHLLFTAGLSNEFFQAVCWILVHSLWQGLIAAIAAAVIISLTKRSSASTRYNLLVMVVALFTVSVGITAYRQFQFREIAEKGATITVVNNTKIFPLVSDNNETLVIATSSYQNLLQQLSTFCNEYANIIVLLWFLLFMVKCARLVAGLRYIRHIRRWNNQEVNGYWKKQLVELAQKAGIKSSIIFLESQLVKVPAVIGFLKPVLLVPATLLSHLPPEQIEAILLHELAHIHRKDFLVNLLQSFLETFFFFNPAVVWISSLIRQEREACCDDIVIANTVQKASYLQALVSFQEFQLRHKSHAIALTGNQHDLFNRVKRMLTQENKKLNLMEKTVLLLSIIGITAFGFITKETKEDPKPVTLVKKEIIQPVTKDLPLNVPVTVTKKHAIKQKKPISISLPRHNIDTVPKTTLKPTGNRSFPSISSNTNNDGNNIVSKIEATDNEGKHYRIKRVDGQVTEMSVNGSAIPQNQFDEYREVIRQIDETQKQRISKRKEDYQLRKADAVSKQKERTEKMKLKNELVKKDNLKRVEDRKLFEKKMELKKAEYNQKKTEIMQKQKLFRQERKGNDDVSRIISDLNNRKLIADSDNLSFSLNNSELIVNGTKQPVEIHRQFKEKYIQNSSDQFKYSRKGHTTSITINKE